VEWWRRFEVDRSRSAAPTLRHGQTSALVERAARSYSSDGLDTDRRSVPPEYNASNLHEGGVIMSPTLCAIQILRGTPKVSRLDFPSLMLQLTTFLATLIIPQTAKIIQGLATLR
jgi:hypothetical protein